MSAPRVYIFVNGILSMPGDADGWTDRAVTWINTRTSAKGEKWEYATGPLLRRIKQQERAQKIATLIAYYERAGYEVILVGHSNGCDIIGRVLALRGHEPWYYAQPLRSVHLFAAAADAEPFLAALDRQSVGRIFIYRGGRDRALQLGRFSRRVVGWAGLGYGSLGREDPDNTAALELAYRPGVAVHQEPAYGHSDWFIRGEFFEVTMRHIVRAEEAVQTEAAYFVDEGEPGPGI